MKYTILLVGLVMLGVEARGQVLTSGQVLPTNTVTYIPPTNGAPSSVGTLNVAQTQAAIGNQNLSATNQINQPVFLTCNGVIVAQLIQKWGTNGSITAQNTNLIYNPTSTNNTATPDVVWTLATNLTFGITYAPNVTNNGSTNVQYTINRLQ